jgi:hypothetical protein
MKFIPYRFRPSLGFLLLILVSVATVIFFAWGLQEPDLDIVWRVQHGLRQGPSVELNESDRAALERALVSHPELRLAIDGEGRAVRSRVVRDEDDQEGGE